MIAQENLIGSRFEKCIVERLIGRGGYGLTFLAFDEELQEHRVIKVSQDSGLDEASKRRHLKTFLEEGLILSRLKHPQIVTLRGQGDKHGHRYMILDYIQGYSLRNLLDIVGQRQAELGCAWQDLLDPVTASALILSALYPMEYAHRANVHLPDREIFGVAHRDISPGNLILGVKGNEKGRLVLIDFGTAKTALTENVTVDQNLVGTIPYMGKARLQKANNPEQKAQYQDFWKNFRETQHDIHAIGVLYYQLLTGQASLLRRDLPADHRQDPGSGSLFPMPSGNRLGAFLRIRRAAEMPGLPRLFHAPERAALPVSGRRLHAAGHGGGLPYPFGRKIRERRADRPGQEARASGAHRPRRRAGRKREFHGHGVQRGNLQDTATRRLRNRPGTPLPPPEAIPALLRCAHRRWIASGPGSRLVAGPQAIPPRAQGRRARARHRLRGFRPIRAAGHRVRRSGRTPRARDAWPRPRATPKADIIPGKPWKSWMPRPPSPEKRRNAIAGRPEDHPAKGENAPGGV